MEYLELDFLIPGMLDYQRDILINALGEIGFDTFEETRQGFKSYIPGENFNEDLLTNHLAPYLQLFTFTYGKNFIPQKNWNEVFSISKCKQLQIGSEVICQ
jgi:ribosomal protein L11 methyltransferase